MIHMADTHRIIIITIKVMDAKKIIEEVANAMMNYCCYSVRMILLILNALD